MREFIRTIQAARKDAGLQPTDEASLTIQSDIAREMIKRNEEKIKNTIATSRTVFFIFSSFRLIISRAVSD